MSDTAAANSCSSSCKVEVKATQLGHIAGIHWYHLFIVFTDQDGEQYFFRGGPGKSPSLGGSKLSGELSGGSSHSASGGTSDASTSGKSGSGSNPSSASDSEDGGPYGTIHTKSGKYEPGTIDYDPEAKSVEVASGPDACKYKDKLEEQMKLIQDSNTRYSPLGPNSNSTVFTALRNVSIDPKVPDGVWAPGARTHISVPKIGTTKAVGSPCVPCHE